MTNELTPAFFKQVFLGADKDDDCKITLKQLGKKSKMNNNSNPNFDFDFDLISASIKILYIGNFFNK